MRPDRHHGLKRILHLIIYIACAATVVAQPDSIVRKPLVERKTWGDIAYHGNPWVQNVSLPHRPTKGLTGRHISLCASHGRYYNIPEQAWSWQRPKLYCTTEDLLTQTFCVPFLYPMLEHAGAVVWTARERAWQREEVIVDNDKPSTDMGTYHEQTGKLEWEDAGKGFVWAQRVYLDGQNPHEQGTSRMIATQTSKKLSSSVTWTPQLPKDGNYAVYVSYPSLPTNVPDAQYTIRHSGINTTVKVNQQMGGGTWVYLGSYDFGAGQSPDNAVTLSNVSNYRGVVSADAVRFGGGMGNIARADSTGRNPKLSGLPRYLEGARYSAQWYGFPYSVYSFRQGTHDYNDDILTRPLATNYLARGSAYLPGDSGLCVPLEMCLAFHSDAGYTKDMSLVGSLGIYTTDFEDGIMPSGLSRKASGTLSTMILDQIGRDMRGIYGKWNVRYNWDRNYGESRVPRLPGIILEMFSHQNLSDMMLAHDPTFKFNMARAIYKTVLRYSAKMHGEKEPVVQPLPVASFAAHADKVNHTIELSWQPVDDPLEKSAKPTAYIVYQSIGEKGFDNGTLVEEPRMSITPQEDVLYRFRVEAVNEGGNSMPSEELCAMLSSDATSPTVLIVNGFTRLAAPYAFDNDSCRGFRMDIDPGVAFQHTPEYCGPQLYFNKNGFARERSDGLGYSSERWVGTLIKGNTFDYPTLHARDIMAHGQYNISSCSRLSLENGTTQAGAYQLMDVIMGAQRHDGYSRNNYKTFTPALKRILHGFTEGGGALLLSGAYIGTDMASNEDQQFTEDVLHYCSGSQQRAPQDSLMLIAGMNTQCSLAMQPNEEHLSTAYVSSLQPSMTAASILLYQPSGHSAAIAYKGADHSIIALGFPIEQIRETDVRRQLMGAFLNYLRR